MATSDELVARVLEVGRAAWPGVSLSPEALAAHLDGRVATDDVVRVCDADLYVACACLAGDAAALAALRELAANAVRSVPDVRARPGMAAELEQDLLVRLLCGDRPRLREYAGRGPLAVWLRVVAVRMAVDVHRHEARHVPYEPELADRVVAGGGDAELAFIKERYREAFQQAFREAVLAMARDDRVLLRLHYAEGVNIDGLAAIRRTSRATAHRRLAAAREALLAEACRLLRGRLGVEGLELESLLGILRSRLHLELSMLFVT